MNLLTKYKLIVKEEKNHGTVPLRCRSENSFRENFHKMYHYIDCLMCGQNNDSQEHAIEFHIVKQHLKPEGINILCVVRYEDIFATIDKQVPITKLYVQYT